MTTDGRGDSLGRDMKSRSQRNPGISDAPQLAFFVCCFGSPFPETGHLPGCIATGKSEEEVRSLIREAIDFHIKGLREELIRFRNPVR